MLRKQSSLDLSPSDVKRTCYDPIFLKATKDTKYLSELNAHSRDTSILFEPDEHVYFVNWNEEWTKVQCSVSGVVAKLFPKFNGGMMSRAVVKGKNYMTGKYAGMTCEQIELQWKNLGDEAARLGTKMHDIIERDLNFETLRPDELDLPEIQQYQKFKSTWLKDKGLKPYRTEWRLYSDQEDKVVGTADLLCANLIQDQGEETLLLTLFDHKRSVKPLMTEKSSVKGYGPCNDLSATSFNKYAIALNLYKYNLEKYYKHLRYGEKTFQNVKITDMYLDVMHPDIEDGPHVLRVPDWQHRIPDILKYANSQ